MNIRDRIGIDVGRKLSVEDAVKWAVDNDVTYIDCQIDVAPNALQSFDESRAAPIRDACAQGGVHLGREKYLGEFSGVLGAADERPIQNTDNDEVYLSGRFFSELASGDVAYRVPLPPGRYRVTLHFAEVYGLTRVPGTRVFDVLLEGEAVLENYDMRAEAGFATADFYSFPVDVEDGILEIGFVRRVENPKFSAIEIERVEAE